MLALLLAAPAARAASLDLLEVGGRMGTVAATNPTAIWWNPAGLAVRGGTQVALEGAPTFGTVQVNRTNPDYGALTPVDGFPSTYDYGGKETFTYAGVVPFVGASTDFGVEGLGVGVGLYVPTAKGSKSTAPNGPNRFAVRQGNIASVHATLGAAYQIADRVSLGLSGTLVNSRWSAVSDASTYPDLVQQIRETNEDANAQDGYLEGLDYSSTLVLGGVKDNGKTGSLAGSAFTFGAGVYVTPIDDLGISIAYDHGYRLTHDGDLTMSFRCPPETDVAARAQAEDGGLCNVDVPGAVDVSYQLPSRLNLGVAFRTSDRVRVEVMGGWVGWSVFDDYEIGIQVSPSAVGGQSPPQTAAALSQQRLWARGAKDTFWVGADGKFAVSDRIEIGSRVLFDKAALPTKYVSANNLDADSVVTGASASVALTDRVGLALSFSNAFFATRRVKDSVFFQDLAHAADPTAADYYRNDDAVNRVYYPSANGTYGLSIQRVGISLQARFGGPDGAGL